MAAGSTAWAASYNEATKASRAVAAINSPFAHISQCVISFPKVS